MRSPSDASSALANAYSVSIVGFPCPASILVSVARPDPAARRERHHRHGAAGPQRAEIGGDDELWRCLWRRTSCAHYSSHHVDFTSQARGPDGGASTASASTGWRARRGPGHRPVAGAAPGEPRHRPAVAAGGDRGSPRRRSPRRRRTLAAVHRRRGPARGDQRPARRPLRHAVRPGRPDRRHQRRHRGRARLSTRDGRPGRRGDPHRPHLRRPGQPGAAGRRRPELRAVPSSTTASGGSTWKPYGPRRRPPAPSS